MENKSFISQTEMILLPGFNIKRLCSTEFECINSKEAQKCILVFGINPSGDEKDAIGEKDSKYLYYLPNINVLERTYPNFYKPIFEIISMATNYNAKWDWCNYREDELKELIKIDKKLKPYSEEILEHYLEFKDNKYSIYIGEFFYYHMKSQSDFLKLVNTSNIGEHMIKLLNMHIKEIINKGNSIELIYINNATASHELCKALGVSEYCSSTEYEYNNQMFKILFGSMLSGRRAMDSFSKARLINEMKEHLAK